MTRREAQEILLSYRPGDEPANDPQVAAALEIARTDTELRAWYEEHRAWDSAVRQKFAALPVPADLKTSILAGEKIIAGPAHWWNRRAALLAAAAMIALLITLASMLLRGPTAPTNGFAQLRTNVIGTVLREYRMDLETNDMNQIRGFLASHGAPADYALPAGLQKLPLAGCGVLKSQDGKPVTMVCFEGEQNRYVWLFFTKAANWPDRPSTQPDFNRVFSCATVSWSDAGSVYVMASETSEAALRKLL